MAFKPSVGDTAVVEARVTAVDENTFTILVGDSTKVTLPHGHPSVVSLTSEREKAKKAMAPKAKRQNDLPLEGVATDDQERDRKKWR